MLRIVVRGVRNSCEASATKRRWASRALPDWAFAPHETGELPGVRNDVGIVYGPNGSYVIAIFSRWADVDEATWVGARVSRLVYDRYAG